MSNSSKTLTCDFKNERSVAAMIETVLDSAFVSDFSLFKVESGLPYDLEIEHDREKGYHVRALADECLLGRISSSRGGESHRYLKIERGLDEIPKGLVAHQILNVINALEGRLEQEYVPGPDLVLFYLREGYVPVDCDWHSADPRQHTEIPDLDKLPNFLVDYLVFKTPFDRTDLPIIKMEYNPSEAETYWKKIIMKASLQKTG